MAQKKTIPKTCDTPPKTNIVTQKRDYFNK